MQNDNQKPDVEAEKQKALDAYWAASTPEAERVAYARMVELGMTKSYGEAAQPAAEGKPTADHVTQAIKDALDAGYMNAVEALEELAGSFGDEQAQATVRAAAKMLRRVRVMREGTT